MKLVIKVGEAVIEVEGQNLKTTKVVGGVTLVEITQSKTYVEEIDDFCEEVTIGLRKALMDARDQGLI